MSRVSVKKTSAVAGYCLAILVCTLLWSCSTPQWIGRQFVDVDSRLLEVEITGNENKSWYVLVRAAEDSLIDLSHNPKEWLADDAAFLMEEYYREDGYHRANVEYEFEPGVDGKPGRVRFDVAEGPRAVIERISFDGRTEGSRKILTSFFDRPSEFIFEGKTPYSEDHVRGAARLIEAWYMSEGYLQAEVDEPEVEFQKDETEALLTVTIRPGLKYSVGEVHFEGVDKRTAGVLREALEEEEEQPYTRYTAAKAERRLVNALRALGHPKPGVRSAVKLDHDSGVAEIEFTLAPGPVFTVDEVVLKGLERTNERYIRSMISVEPGETFNGEEMRDTLNRLYGTALFGRVNVTEDIEGSAEDADEDVVEDADENVEDADENVEDADEDDDHRMDIILDLQERDPYAIDFLVGYGSYELGRTAVTFTDRNFLGRGLRWSTGGKLSFKSARASTSITDPYFLRLPLEATVELSAEEREHPSFTETSQRGVFSVTRFFSRRLRSALGYAYSRSKADEELADILVIKGENLRERYTASSVFTRWILDYRDNPVMPREGHVNEVTFEWFDSRFGGELDFNRFNARSTWNIPLDYNKEWVVSLSARAGVIVRHSDTSVIPLQERFFNGGPDSVRSFKLDELGPTANSDPLGGEYYSTGNIELRAPIAGRLRGAAFADAGNVILRREEIAMDDYRYALGFGLRYSLPIGPVRLDWGWNPNKRHDEDLWVLHLTIGFPF